MALMRLQAGRHICQSSHNRGFISIYGSCRSYSDYSKNGFSRRGIFGQGIENALPYGSAKVTELKCLLTETRSMSTRVKAPPQVRQGGLQLAIFSPGMIYDPYTPREPISFLRRCFTPSGWKRTKEDIIVELKNAYAIAKLRKLTGYSKKEFYQEAIKLYKEISTLIVKGDKTSLRKAVTEHMYSVLKNEMKQRESRWNSVYWELVEPVMSIRTLRARMIGVDKNNLDKAFIQLTLEFLSKQKFEAYDLKGAVVSGDKAKEVLVRDIWVFERSLFHTRSYWRLCGRISL
ncbi:hypothetical protein QJS10_CPA05g00914 [Acorus calamus]|uniref:Large ribosomal subunit protein mL45 n=1 Tax=Acorus calamus TaxID=4465 RepID=A0AAV9EUT4_ACOCL|nr:hypothetical protein QJS10_CPA05g00914 [Acorus calamus]